VPCDARSTSRLQTGRRSSGQAGRCARPPPRVVGPLYGSSSVSNGKAWTFARFGNPQAQRTRRRELGATDGPAKPHPSAQGQRFGYRLTAFYTDKAKGRSQDRLLAFCDLGYPAGLTKRRTKTPLLAQGRQNLSRLEQKRPPMMRLVLYMSRLSAVSSDQILRRSLVSLWNALYLPTLRPRSAI
jgi:hypothetical protein